MSLAAISCLQADFVDDIDEEHSKGEDSMPSPLAGDDSLSTLDFDFNCNQTSKFESLHDSRTNLHHILNGDASRRKRLDAQFKARSCKLSPKRVRLPTIPSDRPSQGSLLRLPGRPSLTKHGSLRRMAPSDRPSLTTQRSLRRMAPTDRPFLLTTQGSFRRMSLASPLGGKKPGIELSRSPAVLSPQGRTGNLRIRSPALSPKGRTGIMRVGLPALSPLGRTGILRRGPMSPRAQGLPRHSPVSRPRKIVHFDLPDEVTVGSLMEEESMGFSDLADDSFESDNESDSSFRCDDQYFKNAEKSFRYDDQYFKSTKEFRFVDALELPDDCRGIVSRCMDLNLNSSDTDSFADYANNRSYTMSETGPDDDDETLEASDQFLGKSNNDLSLAGQGIEQIIGGKPSCFGQSMEFSSSWNDEESITDLNEEINNSSSESISPTSIVSFPDVASWAEGKDIPAGPKFVSL